MYKGLEPPEPKHQRGSSAMSIQGQIPQRQRRRLHRHWRKTRSRIEALRCRVLRLSHEGYSVVKFAERVDCARATVYRTVYRYEEMGESGVIDRSR